MLYLIPLTSLLVWSNIQQICHKSVSLRQPMTAIKPVSFHHETNPQSIMPVLDGTAPYRQEAWSSSFLLAELNIAPAVLSPYSQGTKLTTFGARRTSTQPNTTEGSRLFITSKARKTHYKMKRNLFLIFFLAISLFFCTLCMYSPSSYTQAITLDFGELLISYTYRAWVWLTLSFTSYRERMGSAKINIFFSALVDKNERKK